jgi:tetratricopeptide (TPR) repeat protein
VGADTAAAHADAEEKGRKLLRRYNADVLVWGSVAHDGVIRARFLSAGGHGWTKERTYKLTEEIVLPKDFSRDLAAALAAQVAAQMQSANGATDVLERATSKLGLVVENPSSAFAAEDRAMLIFSYANALRRLGQLKEDCKLIERAIAAFEEVLQEHTRERAPSDWARTKAGLGIALYFLGKREKDSKGIERAIAAYEEALQEYTCERAPSDWAGTKSNLGFALYCLGEREKDSKLIERAIAAFEEVLQEYTRERAPSDWARTKTNLGVALWALAKLENDSKRIEQAIAAYEEALQEYTRERNPVDWARTKGLHGFALYFLGEREKDSKLIERAIAAFEEVLQEYTRERAPSDWARTKIYLGTALLALGNRLWASGDQTEALVKYRNALKVGEEIAAAVREDEIEKEGKEGERTAAALGSVAWHALFTRDFERARDASAHALSVAPKELWIRTNVAHAALFLASTEEEKRQAKGLYAHKGEKVFPNQDKLWEQVIAEDFAQLRTVGLDNPLMKEVEKELGIAH